jgi:hypothetical protein
MSAMLLLRRSRLSGGAHGTDANPRGAALLEFPKVAGSAGNSGGVAHRSTREESGELPLFEMAASNRQGSARGPRVISGGVAHLAGGSRWIGWNGRPARWFRRLAGTVSCAKRKPNGALRKKEPSHFERPWAKYAIEFNTFGERRLSPKRGTSFSMRTLLEGKKIYPVCRVCDAGPRSSVDRASDQESRESGRTGILFDERDSPRAEEPTPRIK